jgi:TonB family protein
VRKNGSVDSFQVIRGLGYGLNESAMRTIASKWRFKPATFKGQPVDCEVDIEVYFTPF